MKNKFTLSFLLLFLSFVNSYGQNNSEYTLGITQFINWIHDLDGVILKITEKEKLKSLDRQLGYASYDINRISWQKDYLLSSILRLKNVNEQEKSDELMPIVADLRTDIDKLISRLEVISGMLSQTDQIVVNKIVKDISWGYRNKKLSYLENINMFLFGKKISISTIKDDATAAKDIAEKATKSINIAREKIKAKLAK